MDLKLSSYGDFEGGTSSEESELDKAIHVQLRSDKMLTPLLKARPSNRFKVKNKEKNIEVNNNILSKDPKRKASPSGGID